MKTATPHHLETKKTRVLIVEDHPIVRQGLTQLINQESDLTVCGEAEDPQQALEEIETARPEIVIVDLSLKDQSGLEFIKDLSGRYPQLPVLVVSMHEESLYAERALRAGARGYVMKQEATDQIMYAIRRVVHGEIYVSETMAGKLLRKVAGSRTDQTGSVLQQLSDRELEVFQLIGRGLGTRQIAERLYLSVKTVETYREQIKQKLNLQNATELIQYATLWVQGERSVVSPRSGPSGILGA